MTDVLSRFPVEKTLLDGATLTPKDVIRHVLTDLTAGNCKPRAMLLAFIEERDGETKYPFATIGFGDEDLEHALLKFLKEIA